MSFCLQCPNRPWADRQWGLCIFDDVLEHCSPSSFKYADHFLPAMLQSLCDPTPEVRQAAAYGVGVAAQFGGENYSPFCTSRIHCLYCCRLLSFPWYWTRVLVFLQRPFLCSSASFRRRSRALKKTSTPRRTASLLLERWWGFDQNVSMSTRSFPIGSAGSHSLRTKRRLSTLLTSCVTLLKGKAAHGVSPSIRTTRLWSCSTKIDKRK